MSQADRKFNATKPDKVREFNYSQLLASSSNKSNQETRVTSELVDSLCRVLVNENQLDINDVGIGALAMQGSQNFKKNNLRNYVSSSNILSDGQNPIENSRLESRYKFSEVCDSQEDESGSLVNTEFASRESTRFPHKNSPGIQSMQHPIIRAQAKSSLKIEKSK